MRFELLFLSERDSHVIPQLDVVNHEHFEDVGKHTVDDATQVDNVPIVEEVNAVGVSERAEVEHTSDNRVLRDEDKNRVEGEGTNSSDAECPVVIHRKAEGLAYAEREAAEEVLKI